MNLKRYNWKEFLAELPPRPKVQTMQAAPWTGGERPGDAFNKLHSVQSVLENLGFTASHVDHDGTHFCRPGKEARDGHSATIYADAPDKAIIWSSTVQQWWPTLEINKPYDAFGLYVGANFEGDFSRATTALKDEGYGDDEERSNGDHLIKDLENYLVASAQDMDKPKDHFGGWKPINLADDRYSTPPPQPDLFRRTDDDTALLYRNKIHYMFGLPESCKSFAAQVACVWTLREGKRCIYFDFENDPWSVRERLVALGASLDALRGSFTYLNPDRPWTSEQEREEFFTLLKAGADIVVVDGMSNAMSLMGKSPMSHEDTVAFEMNFLRPLTRTGGAVVAIDHTSKQAASTDPSFTPSLFGSQHKKAAITGASFYFKVVKEFGRGMTGLANIVLDKDKPGFLRQSAKDGVIAEFSLESHSDGTLTAFLTKPGGYQNTFRPDFIMEEISKYLEYVPSVVSVASVLARASLSPKIAWKQAALNLLVQEGYVALEPGDRVRHVKRFYKNPLFAPIEAEKAPKEPFKVPAEIAPSGAMSDGPLVMPPEEQARFWSDYPEL